MKSNQTSGGFFSRFKFREGKRNRVTGATAPPTTDEPQFEFELFSAEQREQHGRRLARLHRLKRGRSRDLLLARLDENERILLDVHHRLVEDIEADHPITPAGEWLLDNFYIIEEQIRMARRHLPKDYSRELPLLANTLSAGLPRVYDIAQAAISHGDGRVDADRLGDLVSAYQTESPLLLGELWAIPIMFRLALIENIRKVAAVIAVKRKERIEADHWAERMIAVATDHPRDLILVVADMARSNPALTCSFVSEFSRRLRDLGPALALPLTWVEQQLAENNQTTEQLVRTETQWQLGDQVAMGNCIGSLRTLDAMDWREFVERMSLVQKELSNDPAGIYARMDFESRDQYRHVVEETSKNSPDAELEVARKAVALAVEAERLYGKKDRRSHVGFYLIDRGLLQLEKDAHVRIPFLTAAARIGRRLAFPLYTGGILALTGILTYVLTCQLLPGEIDPRRLFAIVPILLLASGHLAVALVNWIASVSVRPHELPRMDFSDGIPPSFRTLVVVPAMLTDTEGIEKLCRDLEVRFLANRDPNLHFALLTDFKDASSETEPEDAELLQAARKKMNELNQRYPSRSGDVFFLFHRPRQWNPRERVWMGYERKRGKLAAVNRFLRNGNRDGFSLIVGETSVLSGIRFVITLDADTQLPREVAGQLVGAMAHPLNRPVFDESSGRIVSGYGILQPRVSASMSGSGRSTYAVLHAGEIGIDPYTRATSDVYQDLFGEGSFIGKGIYDVDAFEQALAGRFPENSILSHDLLEGCYARSGLISDVHLYEEFPSRYLSDTMRRHRWIRGDWQIARWIFPAPPTFGRSRPSGRLSRLSRWKIADNLRRSLTPAALVAVLFFGWFLTGSPWFWTGTIVAALLIPTWIASLSSILHKTEETTFGRHLFGVFREIPKDLAQTAFSLTVLPYEACYSLDAVCRALWRMTISHRKLLQWQPSALADRMLQGTLGSHFRAMGFVSAAAAVAWILLAIFQPAALPAASCILVFWLFAPVAAWYVSREPSRRGNVLNARQTASLRKIARKIWSFFETYVGEEDNWLPPDNYQEHPVARVAHRTSPTNIGLSLLANLAACDFGYITRGQLLFRCGKTFATMDAMERFRGHFYNWYDTKTLAPLPPRYISSVDSGNLAGHLMTLRAGLYELPDRPMLEPTLFAGLHDALALLEGAWDSLARSDRKSDKKPSLLSELRRNLDAILRNPPEHLSGVRRNLATLNDLVSRLVDVSQSLRLDPEHEFHFWLRQFRSQCLCIPEELERLAPWLAEEGIDDSLRRFPVLDENLSLRDLSLLARSVEVEDETLRKHLVAGSRAARSDLASIDLLIGHCNRFCRIEYDFLCDESRHLMAIGFNVDEGRRDAGFYDLLASEARLASFVGIAEGALPQEYWFAMSRILTASAGRPVLLSWSGSMFEYLMPMLVMPSYEETLLDETVKAAVAAQIAYGKTRGVPWGISESGYYTFDARLNYQYRAFGVPGLGLTRGLASDLVIAPYATVMALMVAPKEAFRNLARLSDEGFEGIHGYYEAVDFTPARLPRGRSAAIVRSFMSHHQGMSFLALAYQLLDKPMQRRFVSDPLFQATLLLLQERIPDATATYVHTVSHPELKKATSGREMPLRIFTDPNTPHPEVQLLSNGRYHVMVTETGAGYSRWKELALTRWREDVTQNRWGTFFYLRDVATGEYWSTTFQPTLKKPKQFEVVFGEGRAEFHGIRFDYDVRMDVVVSPEDDIELRRIRITNRGKKRRTIEITGYTEVVLASAVADALHPAFGKLFVQTEILRQQDAILCNRRPRAEEEQSPFLINMVTVHGTVPESVSFETDRQEFLGRNGSVAAPSAMTGTAPGAPLSGRDGSVLDPVLSIRTVIRLEPGESTTIDFALGIGETRDAALKLMEKYREKYIADRIVDMASTHGHMLLHQLNATEFDAQLYNRLAGSILYANPSLRASESILLRNRRGQSGLWGYSISGDWPIVLLKIEDQGSLDLVRQLLKAHEYWRLQGLTVDLVIWNEDQLGYRQLLNDRIMELITAGSGSHLIDRPGGIFLRASDRIADEDRILIQAVSRVILSDTRGTLSEQIEGFRIRKITIPPLNPSKSDSPDPPVPALLPRQDLIFSNGRGGFTQDGREYVITTDRRHRTPAPWVNVMANPTFGTVVSESGSMYTWSENAHEFRLTPWENDPVADGCGEAFYLRDEESGGFWSPAPWPCGSETPYVTRHGFGYTVFEHAERGIRSETTVYVSMDAPVKFVSIRIRNTSGRPRKISVTGMVEWVLGDLREKTGMYVVTEVDPETGAVFARNSYNMEFPDRAAFFDVDDPGRTVGCDRSEFIGRNGSPADPAAMKRTKLSGKVGAGLDPCTALKVDCHLEPDREKTITFRLGIGADPGEAVRLVRRFRGPAAAQGEIETVWHRWAHTLGTINVETPDPSFNVLANGWLLYQTMSCRFWGRSATYQSGGAFGFRDQLQDAMAFIYARPDLLRQHLLLCASRQFVEGDVLHWWHPPIDRGVRTLCSDDYLWLPQATCRYVTATGDTGILDEPVRYIEGRALRPGEESYYDLPVASKEEATLYMHCVRSIQHGLRFGRHGLPLMGSGDWNDGMDMVGREGKGESVWLGFFLYSVLIPFSEIATLHDDQPFAERCLQEAERLRRHLEEHAWDGDWYRRAYFDDGTPLGSSTNPECRIDSIAQSWSVLSGAGEPKRAALAMKSLDDHLVRRDARLIQLFEPPFDKSSLQPGYIKGYVPGVRENGGQYTHAAIWAVMAFARLGERQKAWELLNLINPVLHAASPEEMEIYKVEPYVMAADVYASPSHLGRGGWTWYTGSASWMYRLMIESFLGLKLKWNRLTFEPCLPDHWESFTLHYRFYETIYHINVRLDAAGTETTVVIDQQLQEQPEIVLVDDRVEHWVEVRVPKPAS